MSCTKKKCKILELGVRSYKIDKKYFTKGIIPYNIQNLILTNPQKYFDETIKVVDKWLFYHPKNEFNCQQNIASHNQEKNDKYIILDMEYNFAQNEIAAGDRVKKAGFDLLGIERKSGKIVFFEVKKGLNALQNKSGIKAHIKDFEECLYGKHSQLFRKNLFSDVNNIIYDKKQLGLLNNFETNQPISCDDIELVFIYEPVGDDIEQYREIFNNEYGKSGSKRKYETIFVSNSNYKLKSTRK